MRDIVATIQPEQDTIVRTGLAQSVLVQGAPGTGKTAVGLHRAAYLLYAFRDQLARSGVLVVGPNDSFLSYIADVLPALGEIDATQATVASLVTSATKVAVRGEDPVPAALIKGDARMAEVLRRAIWSHLRPADGPLVVPRGAHQWRVGGVPRRRDDQRAAGPRRPLRGRPGDAAAAAVAPGAAADGGLRRLPRRPGAECRGPQQAGQGVRRRPLAGSRPSEVDLAAADRRRVPGACRRGDPERRRAAADHDEPAGPLGRPRPAGRWPT